MPDRFDILPSTVRGKPRPFTLHVDEKDLSDFQDLLNLSKIGASTWWNQHNDRRYGVSREWLSNAKETWLTSFNWRQHEERVNEFPQFKMNIDDAESGQIDIHFMALFSSREDAVPLLFLHGFPSSFFEFLPMMELLTNKYTPETLPYHVIVPSLPDYALSGGSSENVEMSLDMAARIMHQLMIDLGFNQGYVAQGGDLGSILARIISVKYGECKAFHVNMLMLNAGETPPPFSNVTAEEAHEMKRAETWAQSGTAFISVHGSRPATAGLAIGSSPLAMLTWIGEKLLEWADQSKPLDLNTILAMVTLYWFTDTFPRSLYHAQVLGRLQEGTPLPISKEKPMGYSQFLRDLVLVPEAWALQLYPNLVFFRSHNEGGHFARAEQPELFLQDIEDFVQQLRAIPNSD